MLWCFCQFKTGNSRTVEQGILDRNTNGILRDKGEYRVGQDAWHRAAC